MEGHVEDSERHRNMIKSGNIKSIETDAKTGIIRIKTDRKTPHTYTPAKYKGKTELIYKHVYKHGKKYERVLKDGSRVIDKIVGKYKGMIFEIKFRAGNPDTMYPLFPGK